MHSKTELRCPRPMMGVGMGGMRVPDCLLSAYVRRCAIRVALRVVLDHLVWFCAVLGLP